MNYTNYEAKIVELHGLVLEGWPVGKVRNPGTVGGRADVEQLLMALREGTCKWRVMDTKEHAERIARNKKRAAQGEPVYKPRKKAVVSKFKSATFVEDSDGESHVEGDGDDADNEELTPE